MTQGANGSTAKLAMTSSPALALQIGTTLYMSAVAKLPNALRLGLIGVLFASLEACSGQGRIPDPVVPGMDDVITRPTTLLFTSTALGSTQPLNVYFSNSDMITETDNCGSASARIISLGSTQASTYGETLSVTPMSMGSCSVTFVSSNGGVASLSIHVQ